ncbi:MAG TPA: hypothetical protein VH595_10725 [Verrucomicrobiae bacterium]|nr:hypothetical protein [Verrucomicrobiae bacterium]
MRVGELTISPPFKEYFAEPTNLFSGHLLSEAQFTGWRYLILHGTNAIAAAELSDCSHSGNIAGLCGQTFTRSARHPWLR